MQVLYQFKMSISEMQGLLAGITGAGYTIAGECWVFGLINLDLSLSSVAWVDVEILYQDITAQACGVSVRDQPHRRHIWRSLHAASPRACLSCH